MRLHRFYIKGGDFTEKIGQAIKVDNEELAHQLLRVFRFGVGDKVIVFDGVGCEYVSEITILTKKDLAVKLLEKSEFKIPSKKVNLYLALIKKGNFELAAEKCTEVGISGIHPVISERSEKKDINMERLNKIVIEASEQSGRMTVPEVFEPMDLEEAIMQAVSSDARRVIFDPSGLSLRDEQSKTGLDCHGNTLAMTKKEVSVFIGPEGGWSDSELELFKNNNFEIYSLGQNILRAETAAIVATNLAVN